MCVGQCSGAAPVPVLDAQTAASGWPPADEATIAASEFDYPLAEPDHILPFATAPPLI
jgi:hypothetical protein